ncbi:MAG: tRNA adenosine(34) deaminase TadA [Candidatus Omnitrophota bacterium]
MIDDCDPFFMQEALKLAKRAQEADEVPVGAVIVYKEQIIARAFNQVELLKDPTAHAEMIAITQAASHLNQKWLNECVLYVTLEPCSMCAGALVLARIGRICFGAFDPKAGACGSVINLAEHPRLNHRIIVNGGVLQEPCAAFLTNFFEKKRADGRK